MIQGFALQGQRPRRCYQPGASAWGQRRTHHSVPAVCAGHDWWASGRGHDLQRRRRCLRDSARTLLRSAMGVPTVLQSSVSLFNLFNQFVVWRTVLMLTTASSSLMCKPEGIGRELNLLSVRLQTSGKILVGARTITGQHSAVKLPTHGKRQ